MGLSLSDVFSSVAVKELVKVDLPHLGSNQHEIGGKEGWKEFFGNPKDDDKIRVSVKWFYFADDRDIHQDTGRLSYYDARWLDPKRSPEWRLYYTGDFLKVASPGSVLILCRPVMQEITDSFETLYGLVFEQDSGWLRSARLLFNFTSTSNIVLTLLEEDLEDTVLIFARRRILEELGLTAEPPSEISDLELITKRFGKEFPNTKQMSDFARSLVDTDPIRSDDALSAWIEKEERLFRAREEIEVREWLSRGDITVEEFISYSLSVQNRRKSRMGYALQHHLSALFKARGLRFEAQAITEQDHRPDFLFPGQTEYRDLSYNVNRLSMLAAKSSLKDRWRQILTEADRIKYKHLCTLASGVSIKQTEEIERQKVRLVIPASLHETYTPEQQRNIMTIEEFIRHVSAQQI